MHLLALFRSSWQKSVSIFCPGFHWLVLFLVETCESIVSLGFSPLVRCVLCKHPLPVVVLSCIESMVSLTGQKRLHLRWSRLFLRSEEHTSELQSRQYLVCRLLLEKKKKQ